MRDERDHTLDAIAALPMSQQARDDVLACCAAIQDALNNTLARLGRPIDPRVGPAALYLLGDEIERLNKRFVEGGLVDRLN